MCRGDRVAWRKRVKSGEADNKRAAIAGIGLGIVAIIIGLLVAIVAIVALYGIERYQLCTTGAHGRAEYARCH